MGATMRRPMKPRQCSKCLSDNVVIWPQSRNQQPRGLLCLDCDHVTRFAADCRGYHRKRKSRKFLAARANKISVKVVEP